MADTTFEEMVLQNVECLKEEGMPADQVDYLVELVERDIELKEF